MLGEYVRWADSWVSREQGDGESVWRVGAVGDGGDDGDDEDDEEEGEERRERAGSNIKQGEPKSTI